MFDKSAIEAKATRSGFIYYPLYHASHHNKLFNQLQRVGTHGKSLVSAFFIKHSYGITFLVYINSNPNRA